MGYLDHVQRANQHDLGGFIPLRILDDVVGWVRLALRDRLLDHPDVFRVEPTGVQVRPADPASRSKAMASVIPALQAGGFMGDALGESYAVTAKLGGPELMAIDRGAVEAFGIISTGFHLNGIVGDAMWIARRSSSKATFPGQLDNMVAGGWPVGITLEENVAKECAEEAGMTAALASQSHPVGVMTYVMEVEHGLRRHAMYLYDLDVPPDFQPVPVDGEVEAFQLRPIDEVARIVRDSDVFKYNSALAVIDYLLRTGRITPDEPGYEELTGGLKSSLQVGAITSL